MTNKSDIKRWSNSRGEGYLFSMDLLDESGEIRATAFKLECDKFFNMVEVDKVCVTLESTNFRTNTSIAVIYIKFLHFNLTIGILHFKLQA